MQSAPGLTKPMPKPGLNHCFSNGPGSKNGPDLRAERAITEDKTFHLKKSSAGTRF